MAGEIPSELGMPEMMPITTGLGEIYQYVLKVEPDYEDKYDAMELRTIQDWIVKRQLSGIPGIVEINSFGGYLKQYEVAVDPDVLFSLNITIGEVFEALNKNNQNTGGSYIEKVNRAYYIRSEGMISRIKDVEQIVVANRNGIPIRISDIGTVRFGAPKRFGAMKMCIRDRVMLCVCTFSFGLSRKKKIPKRKGPRLRLRCYSDTAIRRRGSNSLRSNRSPLTCA